MSTQALGWVLDNEHTTKGADRLVLISLANHAGKNPVDGAWECWPGLTTIATEANVSRRETVKACIGRLVEAGLVERVVNGAPDSRMRADRRPNFYRILIADGGTPEAPPTNRTRGDARRADGGTPEAYDGGTPRVPQTEVLLSEPLKATKNLSRDDAALLASFEDFWDVYPNKRAKPRARKAWPAAVKTATKTAGGVDDIIVGAKRYADDPNREERFTAHASAWLRDERWSDPPLPPRFASTNGKPAFDPNKGIDTDRGGPTGRIKW